MAGREEIMAAVVPELPSPPKGPYTLALDFARHASALNSTQLAVLDGFAHDCVLRQLVGWPSDMPMAPCLEAVASVVEQWPNCVLYVDATGAGDEIVEYLERLLPRVSIYKTILTRDAMKTITARLDAAFMGGYIKMLADVLLINQLVEWGTQSDKPKCKAMALAIGINGLPRDAKLVARSKDILAAKRSRFDTTELTPGQAARVNQTREAFKVLEAALVANQKGPSREQSLALTALEDSCMWAVKGISREADREQEQADGH